MKPSAVPDVALMHADADADLEAMASVRAEANPDLPPPRLENLRHNLKSNPNLAYLVVRLDGDPLGCGFVETSAIPIAQGDVVVVPRARRRGLGSALLARLSTEARARGKEELEGEVRESDEESQRFFGRRGYRAVGGQQAVALDLTGIGPVAVEPPPGVRILSRAEEPNRLEDMYAVSLDAERDVPDFTGEVRPFAAWRAQEIDRPTRRPDLSFLALMGGEVVGYAVLDDFGADAFHGFTAVKREWRRRGIATALKRSQIGAARDLGFRRLVTESENRNVPMRTLNEKLGYRPEPSLSVVVLRGPLL